MIKHNQVGAISGLGISLVMCCLLLVVAVAFGGWAFSSRQDYKYNTDQKIAAAVAVEKQQEDTVKEADFAQREKFPLKSYQGPDQFGSLKLMFPKTWSGEVDDTGNGGNALVDGFFNPGVVPSISDENSTFALRVQVLNQSYSDALTDLQGLQNSTDKQVTITPYALPKLPKDVGVEVQGSLPNNKSGLMVVLPLRDKTLEMWTEGDQHTDDFNKIILPNFTFSP